ncbi:hypothetical protein KR200_003617, partial [Drosophila serrata]
LNNTMSLLNITNIRNGGNFSRYEMIDWINTMIEDPIERIEELCNGVIYCCIMAELFPGIINMKRVKMMPRLEYEYVNNMRLLQDAFNTLELEQPVPIDLITKGRFKHNFEFIQFFKKFYDSVTQPPVKRRVARRRTMSFSRALAMAETSFEIIDQADT